MINILKLSGIEILLRTLPETFIVLLGIHVICREKFNVFKNILICIALSLLVFFIRALPIYFGVHMLINIIVTISVMAIIGINIIKSIYSTFLIYFMLSLSEVVNMLVLDLFHIDTVNEFLDPLKKCIYGIPSLITLLLFIIIINYFLKRRGNIKKCI